MQKELTQQGMKCRLQLDMRFPAKAVQKVKTTVQVAETF